jgi:hypothetical protein
LRVCPKLYFVDKKRLMLLLEEDTAVALPKDVMQVVYGEGFRKLIYGNEGNVTALEG